MFGFGKSKSVVGLDIGSSAVKAVELKAAGKGYKVVAFALEAVPPDSIVDGAIIDGAAVAMRPSTRPSASMRCQRAPAAAGETMVVPDTDIRYFSRAFGDATGKTSTRPRTATLVWL